MTKRSHRTARYGAFAKRRRRRGAPIAVSRQAVAQPASPPPLAAAQPSAAPGQAARLAPMPTVAARDYSYVPRELRTIGIITGALLLITFVLALVLR